MTSEASHWYQETIIYELHVRTFADGNGDGIGDFKGLTEKLDYLQKLGVGAVWLLPFYPSPRRDDGYDVADYTDIHPDYGSMADFRHFLREAHGRGIKVITELVLNHTSDQHPWFKRACAAKPGSPQRDFYVWNDSPDKYRNVRIIFQDFEESNWTWNAQAQAYYWHRFYSHQPDLNFDNPLVRRAMLKVADFWLGMGVDGMRLDAVPYLIEREGTTCENLPETHAFLKELRAHMDKNFPGRMLLAEANLWPENAVSYFADGDECHMAFHFPLMPRIFMSMWMEDSYPVIDIMRQTPAIPESCQWALFLRNHDELTLEMVSDEERDYMYRAYARDSQARINLGIRRRLAPLMQKNRRKMELINFLLFSFPGTPIIYYGDEIGMGDNFYLGDRTGVRTPMQWSSGRNAGFSTANPQALFPPLVIDPEYHYEAVNVEAEERTPSSFLWWMRRLIAAYRACPELGRGELAFVDGENSRVLHFLRSLGESQVLVAANLSRFAQVADLDLSAHAGCVPVDVFGNTRFPAIGSEPYTLTFGPFDCFWLRLEREERAAAAPTVLPVLACCEEGGLLSFETRARLERSILPALAVQRVSERQRFSGRIPPDFALLDTMAARTPHLEASLMLAEDRNETGLLSAHLFLLAAVTERRGQEGAEPPPEALARIAGKEREGVLVDGFSQPEALRLLLDLMGTSRRYGRSGAFRTQAHAPGALRGLLASGPGQVRRVRSGSHTCTHALDKAAYIKFYRRPSEGINPEVDILRRLAERELPGVPRLLSSLSFRPPQGEVMTLAVVMEYLQGARNGEEFTLEALDRYFEAVLASGLPAPVMPPLDPLSNAYQPEPGQAAMLDAYAMEFFRQIGGRIAQLHTVLAELDAPGMAPEPFSPYYLRSMYQATRNQTHRVSQGVEGLRRAAGRHGEEVPRAFPGQSILERFSAILHLSPTGLRIRGHGDFRLANVLHQGLDFTLVNFDGDPRLPVSERSVKHSPLRDIASMLFSIGITADKALRRHLERGPMDKAALLSWLALWRHTACRAFLTGYYEACGDAAFLPRGDEEVRRVLEFELLKQILHALERSLEENPEETPVLLDIATVLLRVLP